MACTNGTIRRVPQGVYAEANGPVEADPYYLYPIGVDFVDAPMWVLENVKTHQRRVFDDWHTAYHRMLRARSAAKRRAKLVLTPPWDYWTTSNPGFEDSAPQSEWDWNAAHGDPSWP